MTASFTELVIQEIDDYIKNNAGVDVFDLPQNVGDAIGEVEPIFTSGLDSSLVFILKISPKQGKTEFISLDTGDGGIFVHRSKVKNNPSELMFETEEGWTEF